MFKDILNKFKDATPRYAIVKLAGDLNSIVNNENIEKVRCVERCIVELVSACTETQARKIRREKTGVNFNIYNELCKNINEEDLDDGYYAGIKFLHLNELNEKNVFLIRSCPIKLPNCIIDSSIEKVEKQKIVDTLTKENYLKVVNKENIIKI